MAITEYWWLSAVFLSVLALTWLITGLARNNHWLDIPNERSSHLHPTPTGGGLGFILVTLVTLFAWYLAGEIPSRVFGVLVLSLLPAGLGLADDIRDLGVGIRISLQGIAVIAALILLDGVPLIPVGSLQIDLGLAGYVVAALVFLWFINLFNFMDGIDGIASSETLFIALAAWIISAHAGEHFSRDLLLLVVAAVGGFLVLNLPPARIFMGDTGSNFLAFVLAVTGLVTMHAGILNLWVWSILLALFVTDATVTLFSRIRRSETWYHAHRSHAYQVAAQRFASHGKVDLASAAINCLWLFPLAWLAQVMPQWGVLLTVVAYLPLWLLVIFIRSDRFVIHADTT